MSNLILASKSPRRKELLAQLMGADQFVCMPAVKEEKLEGDTIDQAVLNTARNKACEIQADHPESLILSADTIVVDQSKVLGKPRCKQEATRTIKRLSGRWHEVKTGVVLLGKDENGQPVHHEAVVTSRVHFRNLREGEILRYVAGGTCMDKAGSYGIQDVDFVDQLEGSYTNVIGLPAELVEQWLTELGLVVRPDLQALPQFHPCQTRD